MRKILLVSLLLSSTIINAYAQTARYANRSTSNFNIGEFKYGFKAGSSHFRYDNEEGNKYSDGSMHFNNRFHGGIFGEYAVTDTYGLYGEVLYIGKGTKISLKDGADVKNNKGIKNLIFNLDYLGFSVGLSSYPGEDKNFFWLAGLYMSYILSAKADINIEIGGEKIHEKVNLKETSPNLQKLDVGFTGGGGYEFDMGLILGLTGDIGLIRVFKNVKGINLGLNCSMGYNLAKLYKAS